MSANSSQKGDDSPRVPAEEEELSLRQQAAVAAEAEAAAVLRRSRRLAGEGVELDPLDPVALRQELQDLRADQQALVQSVQDISASLRELISSRSNSGRTPSETGPKRDSSPPPSGTYSPVKKSYSRVLSEPNGGFTTTNVISLQAPKLPHFHGIYEQDKVHVTVWADRVRGLLLVATGDDGYKKGLILSALREVALDQVLTETNNGAVWESWEDMLEGVIAILATSDPEEDARIALETMEQGSDESIAPYMHRIAAVAKPIEGYPKSELLATMLRGMNPVLRKALNRFKLNARLVLPTFQLDWDVAKKNLPTL